MEPKVRARWNGESEENRNCNHFHEPRSEAANVQRTNSNQNKKISRQKRNNRKHVWRAEDQLLFEISAFCFSCTVVLWCCVRFYFSSFSCQYSFVCCVFRCRLKQNFFLLLFHVETLDPNSLMECALGLLVCVCVFFFFSFIFSFAFRQMCRAYIANALFNIFWPLFVLISSLDFVSCSFDHTKYDIPCWSKEKEKFRGRGTEREREKIVWKILAFAWCGFVTQCTYKTWDYNNRKRTSKRVNELTEPSLQALHFQIDSMKIHVPQFELCVFFFHSFSIECTFFFDMYVHIRYAIRMCVRMRSWCTSMMLLFLLLFASLFIIQNQINIEHCRVFMEQNW